MENLTPVLSPEEIDSIVRRLAEKIASDYEGRSLVVIGILKGAFIFLSDLVRRLRIPVEIDFMGASSYADGSCSSGRVMLTKPPGIDIRGKDVLIVEDIIDTGLTLVSLTKCLKALNPRSVRICALIDKRERREATVAIDYAGCPVKSGFLVGYGLDYAEKFRQLPGIFEVQLTPSEDKS
jgi:hypoxanthine phosphoribosyltransferase